MDELTIEGKTYISSKRAAAVTGYAKDYIGQLCREGRVEARLVGRSWYVYEPSLEKHKVTKSSDTDEKRALEPEETEGLPAIDAVWEHPVYESEPVSVLPVEEPKEEPKTIEEIESAWREWFASEKPVAQEPELEKAKEDEPVPVAIVREERPVPAQARIERSQDIQPKKPVRTLRKRTKGHYMVIKALLIGVMLIAASVAVVGSGASGSLAGLLKDDIGFIQFIEGVNEIKNNQ